MKKSLQSVYWAGFLAADGNIYKDMLSLALADKDIQHLYQFKNDIQASQNIKPNNKGEYKINRIQIYSKKICNDLTELYNITPKKSLTLKPPNNLSDDEKDAFICGYIDGDGCICLGANGNHQALNINILGTVELLSFIKERLEEIINEKIKTKISPKNKTNKAFQLNIHTNQAKKMFIYFYDLPFYRLQRKWSQKILIFIKTFINKRRFDYENKMREYFKLFNEGKTIPEIMNLMNKSYGDVWQRLKDSKIFHNYPLPEKPTKKEKKEKTIKIFKFVSPNGIIFTTTNLKKFCENNHLCPKRMSNINSCTLKQHKGWTKKDT